MTRDDAGAAGPRASVWTAPGFPALLALTFCGFAGYAALLPLAPLWATRGGAGPAGAGLVNAVMLGVTVAAQLLVPGALRRYGWGPVLAAGLVLLGVPSLGHLLGTDLVWLCALAAVRGLGFAVLSVAGSASAAHLVDPSRRGAAVGAYGLAVALPNLLFMPWGPAMVELLGWVPGFLVGALPVLGVPAALLMSRHLPHGGEAAEEPAEKEPAGGQGEGGTEVADEPGAPAAGALARLAAPAMVLMAVTFAGGAAITFAPQVAGEPRTATAGLLALGLTAAVTRWRVGELADRHGAAALMWPFTVLGALGTAGVATVLGLARGAEVAPGSTVGWVLALAVLGLAYGGLQNLSYVASLAVVPRHRIGTASAVWNAGFDSGTALGALVVGAVASATSFGWGFLLAALGGLLSLPLALRLRRR